jgi:bifunctional non-homologous end joining protein LigD
MGLQEYKRKRNFTVTPEPAGKVHAQPGSSFVIQKHAATRLHYDFRLEMEGVLKSWAVPKGPSLDPGEKRLAVHVEDHPLEYGDFEGIIPKGQYGGGTVLLWDRGSWYPEGDPVKAYRKGHLKFRLEGEKLHGGWHLVRLHGERAGEDKENWLLFKADDDIAVPGSGDALVQEYPASVTTGRTLEEIAADPDRVWQSNREEKIDKKAAKAPAKAKSRAVKAKAAQEAPAEAPAASPVDASKIPGARKGRFPGAIEPQLATLVDEAPQGEEWLHEMKFDGYRVLCEARDGEVHIWTRNGKDWTDRFTPVAEAVAQLPVRSALLDGEVTVLEPDGTTSFQALQNALTGDRERDLVYFAFDLLYLDGYDLRGATLLDRKAALTGVLSGNTSPTIRFSDHVQGSGEAFYRQACTLSLEGIISKQADRPYRSGRGKDWLKVKCLKRQEFVIVGFTDPEGSRTGFGALLLGVHDEEGQLVFAGKVGTGFNDQLLRDLRKRLGKIERKTPAFKNPPRGAEARRSHWVEPKLVGEVAFTEWTREGILRHPAFQGLREDKPASDVVREVPESTGKATQGAKGAKKMTAAPEKATAKAKKTAAKKTVKAANRPAGPKPPVHPLRPGIEKATEFAGIKLSSPDKVLFPEQGVTKRDLAIYYERIADWILPRIADRPLTLVRCPEGRAKQCFYQKHVNEHFPKTVRRIQVEEEPGSEPYGLIDSAEGLLSLVQVGVLEMHIWGSSRKDIEKPDYVVFDLDPDEGLPWERVVEGALLLRDRLGDLGLRSFLKTTGGKGLHVCVPLQRREGWDEVKAFTKAVSERVVAEDPTRYTSKLPKASRKGKIFIDYLRNGRGATSICAYSTRARAGAPVSTPLFWEEIESGQDVHGDHFNVRNVPERLENLSADPWEEFSKVRQSITAAMKKAVGMK